MVKNLRLYRDGTVSVAQMPHVNEGFVHVLATPTRSGLLYYIGHRKNRRTRELRVLAGGFRTRDKAFEALSKQVKRFPDINPKHDPMAKKVYAWEAEVITPWFKLERLSRDQILAFIYRICGDFQIDPPEVIFVKNCPFCYFNRCEKQRAILVIGEMAEFLNTGLILHEVAHLLTDLHSPGIDNHGPLYMREFLRLLTTYTTFTMDDLVPGLRKHKIRYHVPR